jgi:hypothetical protein
MPSNCDIQRGHPAFADLCAYFAFFAVMLLALNAKNAKHPQRKREGIEDQSFKLHQVHQP